MKTEKELLQKQFISLNEIQAEFLKYAPAYAQKEAAQAILKVSELQAQGIIRDGLLYIVLVDLAGSTKYLAEYGNEKASKRIQYFITSSFNALNNVEIRNVGLFLKEIGDAVLFIFQHFPDFLKWRSMLDNFLRIAPTLDVPYEIKTCLHVGEVSLQGVNPLSLAVSQTFKIEKMASAGEIILTEPAYAVAWPTIARAYHGFEIIRSIPLEGFENEARLYKLKIMDEDDILRIVTEQLD
jgi:class 3 adenylate cyclase